MARPRRRLPPGSHDLVKAMIEAGDPITESTIAKNLGIGLATWKRLREDNEDAKELWQLACIAQRDRLIQKMHARAMEGDTNAATFLLRCLHEVSEQNYRAEDERIGVVVQLPGSMGHEEYMKVVPRVLEHGKETGHAKDGK